MLKFKTEHIVELSDWNDLVIKTYGRPYSFQQQDDCTPRGMFNINIPDRGDDYENDTVPEEVNHPDMGVSFAAWLARDPEKKLPVSPTAYGNDFTVMWWNRNFYPSIQMIANDLHAKGLVDAGKYMINIDW